MKNTQRKKWKRFFQNHEQARNNYEKYLRPFFTHTLSLNRERLGVIRQLWEEVEKTKKEYCVFAGVYYSK